ncbi:hypothetical protein [Curtobacterium sp. MCLR17_054]|uniref:hypothetical protein n=1 Tax=Curtobacterium TaxID=2034 RepID=UPI0015E8CA7D|nr:hypothetical protein [Curtobacterium sp. MCLR17_054]WIE69519.1 hypothetical protein DEJ08_005985 [Curtobacterium sp. MCLR17_054]
MIAFLRPAPIAQFFVNAQQFRHGPQSAMTPSLVRVLAIGLGLIGIVWTLVSFFGHPE